MLITLIRLLRVFGFDMIYLETVGAGQTDTAVSRFADLVVLDADPLFVRAPSPGPDLLWGTADDDYGDLRVAYGSPVIDAASAGTGFTPGFASVLVCEDGSRHFVKAASVKAQRMFAESYREAGPMRIDEQFVPYPGEPFDDKTYRGDAYPAFGWAACVATVDVDLDIAGLRVLVTAGAAGIGLEIARAFHQEGAIAALQNRSLEHRQDSQPWLAGRRGRAARAAGVSGSEMGP